jgi:hypothetical protein
MELHPHHEESPLQTRWLAAAFTFVTALGFAENALAISVAIEQKIHSDIADAVVFSAADCRADTAANYIISGVEVGDNAEFWVTDDADCRVGTNRSGAAALCFQVPEFTMDFNEVSAPFDLTAGPLSRAGLGELSDCADASSADARPIVIYVLVNRVGAEDVDEANSATIDNVELDFNGPDAPTLNSLSPIDDRSLLAQFTSASSSGPETQGFELYCATPGGGAGGAGSEACSSPLDPGQIPDPQHLCGKSVGAALTQLATDNVLEPGRQIAVGVAATDRVGNPGPLSNVLCEIPVDVAGGERGDGSCNCTSIGTSPSPPAGALALCVAVACLGYRRHRRAAVDRS